MKLSTTLSELSVPELRQQKALSIPLPLSVLFGTLDLTYLSFSLPFFPGPVILVSEPLSCVFLDVAIPNEKIKKSFFC